MSRKVKINILIILITSIFAIAFSELLVHYQMITFWNDQDHTMGYWLGFWTPLFDAIIVVTAIILIKNYYENELEKKANKLNDFVSVSSDYVWEINDTGVYTYVSDGVKDVLGHEPNEIIGKTVCEFLSDNTLERTSITFIDLINSKKIIKDFQDWSTHKEGQQVLIQINATPIFAKGEFIGYRGTNKDITNEKFTEKKLKKISEEQSILLTLFDKGNSVLFKWKNDEKFSVEYVSSNVINLLGYSKEEFLSKKVKYEDCLVKEDFFRIKNELELIKKSDKDFFNHSTYRVLTKDNKIKWVLDDTVIIRDKYGHILYFVGYIIDITKEKENELKKI